MRDLIVDRLAAAGYVVFTIGDKTDPMSSNALRLSVVCSGIDLQSVITRGTYQITAIHTVKPSDKMAASDRAANVYEAVYTLLKRYDTGDPFDSLAPFTFSTGDTDTQRTEGDIYVRADMWTFAVTWLSTSF